MYFSRYCQDDEIKENERDGYQLSMGEIRDAYRFFFVAAWREETTLGSTHRWIIFG
jgi:hypothetical protein